ncbi:MAG TPA: hypothetical protein VHX61_00695 [Rhizomicrobium sp.]|nr:hypothetical protein [Rhizomicrobium sp.]
MNPKLLGSINPFMTVRGIAQKLRKALVALALVLAITPVIEASASPSPCDCPYMQMHMQSMGHHVAPAKQKNVPCNRMQNCFCGALCSTAMTLPQQFSSALAAGSSEKFIWPDMGGASGHSIKPAIPPPIAGV